MTGIDDAQARWQQVRAKGRVRLIALLVVAVVVVAVIAAVAGGSAGVVVGALVAVVVVIAAVYLVVSKRKTGLSLTPEWAPKDNRRDDLDDDDDDATGPRAAAAAPAPPAEPVEPLRKVDAQILGADLVSLGQTVGPKLEKSYALGNLVIDGGRVVWEPTQLSAGQGAAALSAAPSEVRTVQRAPMWGSWAMFRVETTTGAEWCLRIPSSVELAPALAEIGLTLH